MVLLQLGSVLMPMAPMFPPKATWYTGSGLLPVAMLVPEGHATVRAILIWVAYIATQDHGDLRAQAATKGHAWVCGPAVGGVCVDFCAPYYPWGPHKLYVLKSENHDELAQAFSGHGRCGPAPCWLMQWESWYRWPWPWEVWPYCSPGHRRADPDGMGTEESAVPEEAQIDQLSYHPGSHPVLWVSLPQHLSHLWPAGKREGTGPVESELQGLHNSRQQ